MCPTTDPGKAIVARNATKHGATSRELLVGGESLADWYQFRDGIRARLAPQDALEDELADRFVHDMWKLRRLQRFEAAVISERVRVVECELADRYDFDGPFDEELLGRHVEDEVKARADWLLFVVETLSLGDSDRVSTEHALAVLEGFNLSLSAPDGWPHSVLRTDPHREGWTAGKIRRAIALLAEGDETVSSLITDNLAMLREHVREGKRLLKKLPDDLLKLRVVSGAAPEEITNQMIRHEAHMRRDSQWCLRELEASQDRRRGCSVPMMRLDATIDVEN